MLCNIIFQLLSRKQSKRVQMLPIDKNKKAGRLSHLLQSLRVNGHAVGGHAVDVLLNDRLDEAFVVLATSGRERGEQVITLLHVGDEVVDGRGLVAIELNEETVTEELERLVVVVDGVVSRVGGVEEVVAVGEVGLAVVEVAEHGRHDIRLRGNGGDASGE